MTRLTILAALALGLTGCSELDVTAGPFEANTDDTSLRSLRIDVHPAGGVELESGERIDLLSQSFGPFETLQDRDLVLSRPIHVQGDVLTYEVTPWRSAELPGYEVDVTSRVTLRKADSVQSYTTLTDEQDRFDLTVVPDSSYLLTVVPEDPAVPLLIERWSVNAAREESLELSGGSAVWGVIRDELGDPLAGVAVVLENEDGVESAPATTDANGEYLVRVPEGTWTVIAEGRSHGRDPVLRLEPEPVGAAGLQADLAYGSLHAVAVSGRLLGPEGEELEDLRVRLTSLDLTGYDAGASLTVDVVSADRGNFFAQAIPGMYRVDVLPGDDDAFAPTAFEVEVSGETDLGEVVLEGLYEWEGVITDPNGAPVDGAIVACTELDFGRRTWSTATGSGGVWELEVPEVPVVWTITPPTTRADLAMTHVQTDDPTRMSLVSGVEFTGRVLSRPYGEDAPVGYAVLEVIDAAGETRARALTDLEGVYTLRVAVD